MSHYFRFQYSSMSCFLVYFTDCWEVDMRNHVQIGEYTSHWPRLWSSETRQRLLTLSNAGHWLFSAQGKILPSNLLKPEEFDFNYEKRIHAGIGLCIKLESAVWPLWQKTTLVGLSWKNSVGDSTPLNFGFQCRKESLHWMTPYGGDMQQANDFLGVLPE